MDGKRSLVGSLSNDDDDSSKNGKKKNKKTLALDWQNNNFARACMTFFLCISLPSLQDYDLKLPNFTFCTEREHNTTTSFFFF